MRILLVEDDPKISRSVAKHLRAEGFALDMAEDGTQGEELACVNDYDVILLDIMLPVQDGWTTCRNIRREKILTPVLMLTALDQVGDKIRGLDAGADDYLAKPFHIGELLARIRALARRRSEVRSASIEQFGITMDLAARRAFRNGKELGLSNKEFSLLELFVHHPGKVLSRETISEHLWDMNYEPRSNVVDVFVRLLRNKLDDGSGRSLIQTVRGAGYVFSDEKR